MLKFKYDPNAEFHLNATFLIISVVLGIFLSIFLNSALVLVLLSIVSQYNWLCNVSKKIIFRKQIQALDRLTNSAKLADKNDNYTPGRYRAVVKYLLDMTNSEYYLLAIDANGISNTRHLAEIANEVGAAFHKPAYLDSIHNGVAIYRINITIPNTGVDDSDF